MNSLVSIVRSRRMRLALATGFAAIGVWAFAPYVTNEVGGVAYVNAPLIRLSTPIPGLVSKALPAPGTYLAVPRILQLVTARSLDTEVLGALTSQAAALTAGRDLARRQLDEIAAADARMVVHGLQFGAAAEARLRAGAAAARVDSRACAAEAHAAVQAQDRMTVLAARGFATPANTERTAALADSAIARCAALSARAVASAGEASAARSGVYLGIGGIDMPYAEQQRDRLLLRRQELETIVVDADARLADLSQRIAAERRQLHRAAAFTVTLPGTSVVWSNAASAGSSIAAGAPVLDLVDCSRRFIEVTLPDRRIEAVLPGETVEVRLIGADRWNAARVVRVAALVAAAQATDGIVVEIGLPAAGPAAGARRCDVGRLAEVRFPRRFG